VIAIIDVGGTNIKYGIINSTTEKYKILGKLKTNAHGQNFHIENRLDDVLQKIKKNFVISGIAISTAGIVDEKEGSIVYANNNIPNYNNTELKKKLKNKYHIPVSIENDVNSALLGELNFSNLKNVHSALMFTIGTGIGGALYINGDLYHGFSHSAGEVGYAIINGENIEDIASTTALVQNVQKRIKKNNIDGVWIFDQAINYNNKICIEEINKQISNLTYLISNYVALINPEYVILGGGIMEQIDYLKPKIIDKFKKINKNKLVVSNTKIKFASLGNLAGMLGAYIQYKNTIIK